MTKQKKHFWLVFLIWSSIIMYVISGTMYFIIGTSFTIPFILCIGGLFTMAISIGFNDNIAMKYIWED